MNDLPLRGGDAPLTSAIHLEFIRSVVDAHETEASGAEAVEAFHRSLFLHRHGRDLERCRQDRRCREERLAGLDARLRHAGTRLDGLDPILPALEDGVADDRPNAPWNGWSRAMFVAATLAVVALLLFGVLNVSFNLLESGIVTFAEHPIRAYLWAALLPVGALAVKIGWDFLRSRRLRDVYLWICLGLGMLGVLAWVGTYASIYPNLSRTTAEQIGRLSIFDEPGAAGSATLATGVKTVDMVLVASQAVAEIFLSAVLGIYLTQLYARHRPVKLVDNPVFAQFDAERRQIETEVARERQAMADARGEELRLENQLVVFVSYARSLFQREVVARRDLAHRKRLLIEEMSTQLRSRLDALDREDLPPISSSASGAPATTDEGGGNGHPRRFTPNPQEAA